MIWPLEAKAWVASALACALAPEDPVFAYQCGLALLLQGRLPEGSRVLEDVTRQAPQWDDAHVMLVVALFCEGRWEHAWRHLDRVARAARAARLREAGR